MTTDQFIKDVRDGVARGGPAYIEETADDLLPVVEEIERLRALEVATRDFLDRDVGEPTQSLADVLSALDAMKRLRPSPPEDRLF